MQRKLTAIGLVLLISWLGNSAAQAEDPGPVRVGDRWSYDIKDDATGDLRHAVTVIVVEITDKEITTRVSMKGKDRPQAVIFDLNWGSIDNGTWQYRPSGIGINKPLQIGKEWRSEANLKNLQTGVALRNSGVAKVAAQEQVTTPAGTFETYRVEAKVRQVQTRDQTKAATITVTSWYAPSINRWVKRKYELRAEGRVRDSYLEELTDYSRKP